MIGSQLTGRPATLAGLPVLKPGFPTPELPRLDHSPTSNRNVMTRTAVVAESSVP